MDTFEKQEFLGEQPQDTPVEQAAVPAEPQADSQIPEPQQTSGSPVPGRKKSPFANSPYVMNHQKDTSWYPSQNPAPFTYQPQTAPLSEPEQKEKMAPRARKKSGSVSWLRTACAAVLVLSLTVGSCFITASLVNDRWEKKTQDMMADFEEQFQQMQAQIEAATAPGYQGIPANPVVSNGNYTPAQVYAMNVDAVVKVLNGVEFTAYGQTGRPTSTGSGFIISPDGYVLTNCHVIEGAESVGITTYGGERYNAKIVGYDVSNDVALLKVDAQNLPYVAIGSSDALSVGDQVAAIGNPLGELTATMTVGYISGKERSVTTEGATINMLQTDAAINSGNSGGPLFNMRGEVVGITTSKYSGSSSSGATIEGIGFAIPIDDVMEIANDLMEFGYIRSAYMGVTVQEMDKEMAEVYGLPVGAYIIGIEAGGPAAKAGLREKDIIIALNGEKVGGINDLTRVLRGYEPGDTAVVTIYRAGQEMELYIVLAEKPGQPVVQETEKDNIYQPDNPMPEEGSYEEWFDYFYPFYDNKND